ncbi:MAG TPA: non-ribosomal peptide synthetase [Bryobacteraceae bacterium]|nr:non-ribosomal peptide synthetase [Bryobacteraceae bacterium]
MTNPRAALNPLSGANFVREPRVLPASVTPATSVIHDAIPAPAFGRTVECRRRACMPQLIASMTPDLIALASPLGGKTMAYGELNARADRLASHLASLGVGPEVVVGICLERSFEFVIAALAAWKAGGAYLPIDAAWPEARREAILADSGARVLVTRSVAETKAPHLIDLERDAELLSPAPVTFEPVAASRDRLAYVSYTSGSTGTPKGVEITHGNLLNLVFWHRRAFGITARDRVSHLAGLAFDAAVWELWPHLSAGATVVLVDPAVRTSPELLRDWLVEERIDVAFVPTTLAEPMLAAPWPRETALRYLLTGSDTLHRYPAEGLPFELINNYGPTECAVVVTSGVITATEHKSTRPNIGAAVAQTQIYILDENRQPVEPGEIGEIYIGGANVGRGYRNQPQLTAARFLPDPFSARPGARMYRSGDLGRMLPGGRIEFHGRIDGQEKIRGHRVEPDEVAAVLKQHPLVSTCAVVGYGDVADRQLAAYVVPRTCIAPEAGELRGFLAARLPDYMIPASFMRLESLPLNSSGKLHRAALPAPTTRPAREAVPYRAPGSPLEKRVAAMISEILNIPEVGLDDNFFLLGGHSLLGTQLVLRVRQRFGVPLTLRDLFEAPTAGLLADAVERLLITHLQSMPEEEAASLLADLEA